MILMESSASSPKIPSLRLFKCGFFHADVYCTPDGMQVDHNLGGRAPFSRMLVSANIRPAQDSGQDSLESNLFPQGIPI